MNEKVKKLLPLCLFHLVTSPTAAASDALTKPLPPPQTQQVNTTFEVYCVEGGVDMLKNGDYTVITEFVVAALTSHQQQSAPLVSPHEALAARYFKFPR
ncbi:Hypothetical protein, putative [Bodo saltans]|uniref:Membrane-associated protein n=1 Tax=Bodo saltans TaxID=75058 RepID=A0A0S4IKQ4_BODSA|nr:Hypothetical protein, putative [Bodo saltans]|eukprot:CUE67970.1 Hypothetical protein, putative [Bodo saltans]